MSSKLIIPKDARFMGKTLEEMAKIEKKIPPVQNPIAQKNVQAEDILKIAPRSKGLTQKETVEEANKKGLVLVSNKWADEDLNVHGGLKNRDDTYAIWTGTLIAYRKPGEKLGSEIICTDSQTNEVYTLAVPARFQKEKDCALVVPHGYLEDGTPNITYQASGNKYTIKVADESLIQLIKEFPTTNGWYLTEPLFGIPAGTGAISGNDAARYLYRSTSEYLGLVARGVDFDDRQRDVFAICRPSFRLGVLGQKTE